jgi:hypothetical protein
MANAANVPYRPENFADLEPIQAKAAELMPEKLKRAVFKAVQGGDHQFSNEFQIDSADEQRSYALQQLINSYENETDLQRIDPKSSESILFGPNGMIRRRGGGSPALLTEDIEVGYIDDRFNPIIGPVITSGRNRLLALQIFIKAAAPGVRYDSIKIRCSTRNFKSRDELARRIVQANTESRNMNRAETRERRAGAKGLNTTSRAGLIDSLPNITKIDDLATAFGGFIKLCAIEQSLNGLTLDQYSAAGVTAYGHLRKANKGLNKRISDDTAVLVKMADSACAALPALVEQAMADKSRGPKNNKLARLLAAEIARRHQLLIQA